MEACPSFINHRVGCCCNSRNAGCKSNGESWSLSIICKLPQAKFRFTVEKNEGKDHPRMVEISANSKPPKKKQLMIYIDFHREFHASYFARVTGNKTTSSMGRLSSKSPWEQAVPGATWGSPTMVARKSPDHRIGLSELVHTKWAGPSLVYKLIESQFSCRYIYIISSINSAVLSSGPLFVRFSVVQRAGSPEWSAGSLTRPRSFGRRFWSSMAGFPSMVNSWLGMSLYTTY